MGPRPRGSARRSTATCCSRAASRSAGEILYRQGKIPGSFYTGRGNEAASVAVAMAMGRDDVGAPLHRNMGVHITRGVEPWRIFANYMGRADGPARGRDGNVHMADPHLGLVAMVSHLPAMLPVAVGCALAFRIREERRVAVAWFGEGASARGDTHEGMNFAGVRRLPVVFVCDNNQWAYSTPTHLEYAIEHLADRAAGYGFEGVVVDGTDALAVYREAKRAIEKARQGGGPTLIESVTLRMEGHAIHDDASYVPKELFERWGERDPIERYRAWLHEHTDITEAEQERDRRPGEAPPERGARARRGLAATRPRRAPRRRLRRGRGARPAPPHVATMTEKTYLQAIGDGLRQEMRHDERVFLIGEDIGVYGGAFKVTQGFQEEFGPWRVIDAPLSETAILGGATGAAMMGMRPVAEMQFADFVSCGWDHLVTVAAKQHWRAGTAVPITLRLPSGGGFSGGPFHSQNPESSFAHIPGLKCVCPATPRGREGADHRRDPGSEPGALLRAQAPLPPRQGRGARRVATSTPIGEARIHQAGERRHARHLGRDGLHGRGGRRRSSTTSRSRSSTCARSFPGTSEAVLASVRKTSKVIVLHEDTRTGGFGAEIAATIAEEAFEHLDAPPRRIAAPDTPVPFAPVLEAAFLPQVADVAAALREVADY